MWAAAAVIVCAGACVLIYFGRQARPLWVDEEMLALNARDRSFRELAGGLWLGQAAPLGWLALERASMLTLGLSERAVRALPVFWGLLTLITAVWVGRRWLGPVGAAILALLCSVGNDVWFFALELKHYSADTFGGLLMPSLAAWAMEAPADQPRRTIRRADVWWIAAGLMQWFSYGALFVTPACGFVILWLIWRRAGARVAWRAAVMSLFWIAGAALHYYLGIRGASNSAYLREYWMAAFPPASGGASETFRWVAGAIAGLAKSPGGTSYALLFWIVAMAGLAISGRERSALGIMNTTVMPSALLLALLRMVPLSGRLSLWIVPSLYVGIATAGDTAVRELVSAVQTRRWLIAAAALAFFAPAAVLFLLLQHAVFAADVAFRIGEQRDGDAVAVAEIGVGQAVVARHAEHHAVVLDELILVVREIGGDQGAAGRAVFWIEVQDNMLLALEGRQVHGLHVGIGELERRRGLSGFQHGASILCSLFFKRQGHRL